MSTQDILSELPRLSAEERQLVANALHDLTANRADLPVSPAGRTRIAGLHTGVWEVASDFDAPLPEKFWLGDDA